MFNWDWVADKNITTLVGVWLAAIGTLAIYSILYKENKAYRMAEHIFIGSATGYAVYTTWTQVLKPQWWDRIAEGQWYWAFALVAGSMYYFIYSKKYVWLSRLIFGALMGLIAGTVFKGFAGTNIDRITASFKPLYGVDLSTGQIINNVIFILILLTVMSYFFFSFEHKTPMRKLPSNIGRWVLMFAFGAMFGSTVMARMSLLIGRINFLLNDWLIPTFHSWIK
ncbi:MAG: hypothetical protein ACYC0V_19680 [Armatimonadota bacterium]